MKCSVEMAIFMLSGVVADAILDRIVHNSMTINTGKLNMREFMASHPIYGKRQILRLP